MKPEEVIERIGGLLTDHYPEGEKCRCGEDVADESAWATHAAGVIDADARRWAQENPPL